MRVKVKSHCVLCVDVGDGKTTSGLMKKLKCKFNKFTNQTRTKKYFFLSVCSFSLDNHCSSGIGQSSIEFLFYLNAILISRETKHMHVLTVLIHDDYHFHKYNI